VVDEVIRTLTKWDWDPKVATSTQTGTGAQTSTGTPATSILAHTAITASSASKTTLPPLVLSFIDYANKKILAPDHIWMLLFLFYGQHSLATINKEIAAILYMRIPASVSPQRSIDNLIMHFDRCNLHKQGMLLQTTLGLIIMSKLPACYNTIIRDIVKTNSASPVTICNLAIAIYKGVQSFKHHTLRNSGQANLANAVKHKPTSNPQWHSGNSGSSGSKPKYNTNKKGNTVCSTVPRDSN
jgi:hypothetical protein